MFNITPFMWQENKKNFIVIYEKTSL